MSQQYVDQQAPGFKNRIENVAIVGVAGSVGAFITEHLLMSGKHKVTAITRPDSTSDIPEGVKAKKADYNDHSSLVEALKGQDILIITLSVSAPPDTQSKLIKAAKDAGLQWVMPNEWGYAANEQLGDDIIFGPRLRAIRKEITDLGLNYVGLECGFWYEFSLAGSEWRYGFDFKERTLTLYDEGTTKIVSSTWPQCGRAVAALLSLPILPKNESDNGPTISDWRNTSLAIGSFRASQRDMLDSVLRVTGTKESDWKITHEDAKERYARGKQLFEKGDFTGFGILLYARIFYPDGLSDHWDKIANEKLKLPEESIDEATKVAVGYAKAGKIKY